jgi:hypothetical protein
MTNEVQSSEIAELTKRCDENHRRPAMMPSLVVFHPLQLPARQDLSRPHVTKSITWKQQNYSKAEYTNTQQVLPVGDNYITKP